MQIRRVLCLLLFVFALTPGVASAQLTPPVNLPQSVRVAPPGFTTTANQAVRIAEATDAARAVRREHPHAISAAWVYGGQRWDVVFTDGKDVVLQVDISPRGHVAHTWSGLAAWAYFARAGFAGGFDRAWILLLFGVLFLLPFVDRRRPRRLVHLDLLAILAFLVPLVLLDHGHEASATWTVYPPLLYLLGRMLMIGFGRRRAGAAMVPRLPTTVLVVGVLLLVGGRVALNVADGRVLDIGYASVVGADRLEHKEPLYVDNETHGDTYGPVNYLAYLPFELLLPYHGAWDDLPAARATTVAFDLLTLLGLLILGMQMRAGPEGRRLGLALCWAWAACPLTLFAVMQSTNDGLAAAFVVWTMVALQRPAWRGALLGLAVAAKFFPAAILGAVWRGTRSWSTRDAALTVGACAVVVVGSFALYLPPGGIKEVWDCTLGFQLSRPADFSLWGRYGLAPLHVVLELGALALAAAVAFVPRGRRSTTQVMALAAAVTIALQVVAGHWYFFYVVWFAPLVLAAAFTDGGPDPTPVPAEPRALAHA